MENVTDSALKNIVFKFLSNQANLEGLSLKDLKKHVEIELKLPADTIKGDDSRRIKQFVAEYQPKKAKSTASDKKQNSQTKAASEHLVTGKFSNEDSKIVMDAVNRYAEEHDIEAAHIATFFGADTGLKHDQLWTELGAMLPHRSHKVTT